MELPHPREMGAGRWLSGEGSSQVVCGEVVSLEVHLDVSDVSFWHLFIYVTSSLHIQPASLTLSVPNYLLEFL